MVGGGAIDAGSKVSVSSIAGVDGASEPFSPSYNISACIKFFNFANFRFCAKSKKKQKNKNKNKNKKTKTKNKKRNKLHAQNKIEI